MGFQDNIPGVYAKVFNQVKTHVVVYTPVCGDPIEDVSAIVCFGVQKNTHGIKGDGSAWQLTIKKDFRCDFRNSGTNDAATIQIMASDVPAPKYGDKVVVDGETWIVTEVFDHV